MAQGKIPRAQIIRGTLVSTQRHGDSSAQRYVELSSGSVAASGSLTNTGPIIDTWGASSVRVLLSATASTGTAQDWNLAVVVQTSPQAAGPWLTLTAANGGIGTITEATSLPTADSATYTRSVNATGVLGTANQTMDRFVFVNWTLTNESVSNAMTLTFMLIAYIYED